MMRYSALALTILSIAAVDHYVSAQQCSMCDEGSVDPTLTFDGASCQDYSVQAPGLPADSEDCLLLRAAGVISCGCPSSIPETCSLCGGDELPSSSLDLEVPDAYNLTCRDLLQFPAVDGEDTCSLISLKYSSFCGCPNPVEPACSFCDDKSIPADKTVPFQVLGTESVACRQLHDVLTVQTSQSCVDWKQFFSGDLGIDFRGFCECPNAASPRVCGLYCPEGKQIPEELRGEALLEGSTLDCFEIQLFAEMTTDLEDCERAKASAIKCCLEDTEPPSQAPSPAPSEPLLVETTTSTASYMTISKVAAIVLLVSTLGAW